MSHGLTRPLHNRLHGRLTSCFSGLTSKHSVSGQFDLMSQWTDLRYTQTILGWTDLYIPTASGGTGLYVDKHQCELTYIHKQDQGGLTHIQKHQCGLTCINKQDQCEMTYIHKQDK